jgi:acyl-CoA thioesterase I
VRRYFLIRSGDLLAAMLCMLALHATAIGAITSKSSKAATAPARPVILVLGDSLSAEYGLQRGSGWVQLLAHRLQQSGSNYTVVNASISGETTSGGRTRLPALLKQHRPAIVIIELGGNDGLRGLPVAQMQENLAAMVRASQASGAKVLIAGIRVPPNYGRDFTERFYAAFGNVAKQYNTALVPFLLEGFNDSGEFFQSDRIHPTAQAQAKILQTVWPILQPLLTDTNALTRR